MFNKYKKERDELYNILKAIINKFGDKTIIIEKREIGNAQRGKIFVTKELSRNARKYQLLFEDELLDKFEKTGDHIPRID